MTERIETSRVLALKVWWAFMWRFAVTALLSGYIVGFLLGLLASIASLAPRTVEAFSAVFGIGIAMAASVEVMHRAIRAGFPLVRERLSFEPWRCPTCKDSKEPVYGRSLALGAALLAGGLAVTMLIGASTGWGMVLAPLGVIPYLAYHAATPSRRCGSCGAAIGGAS